MNLGKPLLYVDSEIESKLPWLYVLLVILQLVVLLIFCMEFINHLKGRLKNMFRF